MIATIACSIGPSKFANRLDKVVDGTLGSVLDGDTSDCPALVVRGSNEMLCDLAVEISWIGAVFLAAGVICWASVAMGAEADFDCWASDIVGAEADSDCWICIEGIGAACIFGAFTLEPCASGVCGDPDLG